MEKGAFDIYFVLLFPNWTLLKLPVGLSTRDPGSGSDADRGFGSYDHSKLRALDPVQQCNARSMRAMRSSRDTTMNTDQESRSSESGFSTRVESPII